jgi:hypothetical protein
VTIDITPPVGDRESAAVRDAIVSAGVQLYPRPAAYDSAWKRVASDEAVDNDPDSQAAGYARLPRSTLGATSA